ncbi:hypothetical protein GQ43DRAFT_125912 [Delitschia confertaspora ATCC 74209]|uniref:SH3 domain-containing protein n=1 Tax=Delitschia confertaspora ATCC 74209 TaxID=1513339 RepID=A0A9P4JMJ6_9PLEO|nr:hypothetical protein GQ43DRAFT_125912 [Delitschia confertaspora ATCC 74209]
MTRPHIIRADTLDLQATTSPTAKDHSRQPQHPAPLGVGPAAPHQEASLRHVTEEQCSEEERLRQSTWSTTTTLRDDPGSDDERTVLSGEGARPLDEQAVRLNGGINGGTEDSNLADADADDDLDDDMMDKISSSPSIDDASGSKSPSGLGRFSPVPFFSRPIFHKQNTQSTEHHPDGKYRSYRRPAALRPSIKYLDDLPKARLPRSQAMRQDSQNSLASESDLQSVFLPAFDPLRDTSLNDLRQLDESSGKEGEEASDEEERDVPTLSSPTWSSSWTTDSDFDSVCDQDHYHDDDSNDILFSDDPRFIDSGWGGECLRETEDIDFEFVYALHTFVATVEGQANATKGDTMVLLDDSNSYWWLVRVVKDSSIGYLPAEHIETPTERLARLNKHRNIDLSATMLGDMAEKSKNPLKKAIRRRNAKTVHFDDPTNTYVEASDYDYSSDEENGEEELFGGADPNQAQIDSNADNSEPEPDEDLKVQPLKVNGAKKDTKADSTEEERDQNLDDESSKNGEKARSSDEMVDGPLDPKYSRNGTMRNTDSFFKDDNAETRKIILTPSLLRDDSSTSTTGSRERGPSLESLEKNGFADKVKDDRKKKEKKPGMLSGLFKRKEKKPKGAGGGLDSIDSDAEKVSEEFGRHSPQSERPSTDMDPSQSPQRQPSKGKLQKPQRTRDTSPSKKGPETDSPEPLATQDGTPRDVSRGRPLGPDTKATMRLVSPEGERPAESSLDERVKSPEGLRNRSNSAASKQTSSNILNRQPNEREARPEKVKKAKERVQLDDFDSPVEEQDDPFADPSAEQKKPSQQPDSEPTGRLSESPIQISKSDAQPPESVNTGDKDQVSDPHQPPGLTGDTSSQDTTSPVATPPREQSPTSHAPNKPSIDVSRPIGSLSPTTSLTPASTARPPSRSAPVPAKIVTSLPEVISPSLPAWSDASLRSYLDDGSEIRDMLVVINDTTGVTPAGPEHPIMAGLFAEERKTMAQLNGQLDDLLGQWLERKKKKNASAVKAAP